MKSREDEELTLNFKTM